MIWSDRNDDAVKWEDFTAKCSKNAQSQLEGYPQKGILRGKQMRRLTHKPRPRHSSFTHLFFQTFIRKNSLTCASHFSLVSTSDIRSKTPSCLPDKDPQIFGSYFSLRKSVWVTLDEGRKLYSLQCR